MNTLLRWVKFNLVGAMGMVVQLGCLSLINQMVPGHYLCATAAAIEVTLLHNFLWHFHYTWRDRRGGVSLIRTGARFHLSIGLVSMFGNLALTRLLVREAHLPLLVANFIAVLCCSLANFRLGNRWAFSAAVPAGSGRPAGDELDAGQRICCRRAIRSSVLGCVENKRIIPPPASGFMM